MDEPIKIPIEIFEPIEKEHFRREANKPRSKAVRGEDRKKDTLYFAASEARRPTP